MARNAYWQMYYLAKIEVRLHTNADEANNLRRSEYLVDESLGIYVRCHTLEVFESYQKKNPNSPCQ